MSKTAFSTSDVLTKKAWEEKLFRDAKKEAYFAKFMGDSPDSLIQTKRQLEKQKGDQISFGIRMRLTGSGVTSGTQLEGNEEKLTTYSYQLSLEQYRNAVRDDGAMSRKRAMFDIDEESKMALKDWGSEKIDSLCFSALAASPTKVFYKTGATTFLSGSAATAKAALNASNSLITPDFISWMKTWAKTGGARQYVPLRPVKVKGKSYYILLLHPDAMFDLKTNSDFKQALREAEVRGSENPLFEGAAAIWDGVVIHEHENVSIAADGGGSTVPWCAGSLLGAQSLCWAWGQNEEVVEETFDYKNEHGYAWGMIGAAGKPKFNSLDYGSFGVYLSRTNVSGS